MKQIKKLFPLLLALLLLLTGCGADTAGSGNDDSAGTLTAEGNQNAGTELAATYAADDVFSLNAMLDSSFHPYRLDSAWNRVVDMLVYEPLISLDSSFEAQPGLVTAWSSEDGLVWNFSVDITRVFHSGRALTATDCVYTLRFAMDSSDYSGRFEQIDEITTLGESSFQVKLKSVNWRFYTLLNIPCIEQETYYTDIPGGTGPYKFSSGGDMLLLDENYPTADEMPVLRIYLKQYTKASDILQAFESSYLDMVINDPTGISSLGYSKTNIIRLVNTTNLHFLGYNMQSVMMCQPQIRAAMTYIIDRSEIVSNCMSGAAAAATLPIHPYNSLYPKEFTQSMSYSPESFRTLLENLGLMDVDGDGQLEMFSGVSALKQELVFIVCSDSSAKVSAANRIANAMEDAGLSVTVQELDYDDYIAALEAGEFDIYYGEVKIRADWDCSPLFEEDLNYGHVDSAGILSCYEQLRTASAENQSAAVTALAQYYQQYAPITAICFEKSEVLYHRGVLTGVDPTQDNLFNNLESWTLDLQGGQS